MCASSNTTSFPPETDALSNLFRTKDALGNYGGFDTGKVLLGGLGATALAAPFLMGGGDEDEGPVETMDPAYQTQRARNYYRAYLLINIILFLFYYYFK